MSRDTSNQPVRAASQNTDRSQWISYLIEQYRIDKRLDKPRPTLYRKRVNGDGTRYLVTSGNLAVFQTDDQIEVIQYLADHPGCKLHDLQDQHYFRRKMIGQYLGVREPGRAVSPKLDPTTGKFGQTTESLLAQRYAPGETIPSRKIDAPAYVKPASEIPAPRDATPFRAKVMAIVRGTPIGTQNRPKPCAKCGLTDNCPCRKPLRRDQSELPVARREPSTPRTKPSVTTDDFIRDMRRAAGLKVEVE